jgi:hypothetical protein
MNLKEKLFTIPINEAFHADSECPICSIKKTLETNAIDFTMGPSYMDDTVRAETDKKGFCNHHIKMLYENQNRLGLALILKTHMDKMIQDIEKLSLNKRNLTHHSIFMKTNKESSIKSYTDHLGGSCYICDTINAAFYRYIDTIFYLLQNDSDFYHTFESSKGFCTNHYSLLYELAPKHLRGEKLNQFSTTLNSIYLENLKRVRNDLDWFIDKFDYRFVNEPWKNSKDALPRAMTKVNSIL